MWQGEQRQLRCEFQAEAHRPAPQRGACAASWAHLEPEGHLPQQEGILKRIHHSQPEIWVWEPRDGPEPVYRGYPEPLSQSLSEVPSPINPILSLPCWEVDIIILS